MSFVILEELTTVLSITVTINVILVLMDFIYLLLKRAVYCWLSSFNHNVWKWDWLPANWSAINAKMDISWMVKNVIFWMSTKLVAILMILVELLNVTVVNLSTIFLSVNVIEELELLVIVTNIVQTPMSASLVMRDTTTILPTLEKFVFLLLKTVCWINTILTMLVHPYRQYYVRSVKKISFWLRMAKDVTRSLLISLLLTAWLIINLTSVINVTTVTWPPDYVESNMQRLINASYIVRLTLMNVRHVDRINSKEL